MTPASPTAAAPVLTGDAATLPLWLGLVLTPGLGLRGAQRLLETFQTPAAIYHASLTELEACQMPPAVAQSLHDGRSADLGAAEAERARALGVEVVTLGDRRYPELLREIYDPPILLYVRGEIQALDSFSIAAVGTRRPTLYGRLMAEQFGRQIAQWGLTLTSGLARGVDAISHRAALDAGGLTVAVLGTGVDIIYPGENRGLAQAILAARGALISEFPLATNPAPHNFPIRNRIISGLGLGVLIIEGGEYSGSRITARMALEQNREVFAVPGMATQKQAWLPNALIKQGAKLVTDIADIVEELPSSVRTRLIPPEPSAAAAAEDAPGSAPDVALNAALLHVLRPDESAHIDEIANRLENKLSAPEILARLFDLELSGQVRQLPGKNYLRVR